jgi:hypothetical protein
MSADRPQTDTENAFFAKNAERGLKTPETPYKMATYAFRKQAERGRNACGTEPTGIRPIESSTGFSTLELKPAQDELFLVFGVAFFGVLIFFLVIRLFVVGKDGGLA